MASYIVAPKSDKSPRIVLVGVANEYHGNTHHSNEECSQHKCPVHLQYM